MLRRALAVAFASASLALVPATASATPEHAQVDNYSSTQYRGTATVVLAGGRSAEISLTEDRYPGTDGGAYLSVQTYQEIPCVWGSGTCPFFGGGSVPLSDEQFELDRSLDGASVTGVPVPITRYDSESGTYEQETVTISVVLTGTGPVSRDAAHQTDCPMGGECQSIRVEASRSAVSQVDFGTEDLTGGGSLFRGRSVDAAVPEFQYGG